MTATLINNSGSTIQCTITNIQEVKVHRTSVIDTPTSNGDIIQSLGTKSRRFSLRGLVTGSVGNAQVRALPGVTGSFSFTDYFGGSSVPAVEVFYISSDFTDSADKPSYRTFKLEMIEVV